MSYIIDRKVTADIHNPLMITYHGDALSSCHVEEYRICNPETLMLLLRIIVVSDGDSITVKLIDKDSSIIDNTGILDSVKFKINNNGSIEIRVFRKYVNIRHDCKSYDMLFDCLSYISNKFNVYIATDNMRMFYDSYINVLCDNSVNIKYSYDTYGSHAVSPIFCGSAYNKKIEISYDISEAINKIPLINICLVTGNYYNETDFYIGINSDGYVVITDEFGMNLKSHRPVGMVKFVFSDKVSYIMLEDTFVKLDDYDKVYKSSLCNNIFVIARCQNCSHELIDKCIKVAFK